MSRSGHGEILREVDGARLAVLFIHGFMGSPRQFEPYIGRVCEAGYSADAILLPGHGGGALAFSRAMLPQWEAHVREAVRSLAARYDRIAVVGHSMGGLLGLNESVDPESRIVGVFMIAPPIEVNLRPWSIRLRLSMATDPKLAAMWAHYRGMSSVEAGSVMVYPLWVRQFAALKRLIEKTKRLMPEIRVPVCAVHSDRDEAVSVRSGDRLAEGLTNAAHERLHLKDSWHAFYTDADTAVVSNKLMAFLAKIAGDESPPPGP